MRAVKPIFIFSLPRAGSTLLQRMLMSHDDISSASEPWILLPLLYAFRKKGIYTEYWQQVSMQALHDFVHILPSGREDFDDSLRDFAISLYSKAANNHAKYFVDKTPRYHLIVDEIISLFPDAKFIFLWRNPLATIASIMDTFGAGKWNLHYYKLDLFTGLPNLINAYCKHRDRVHSVNYEALVQAPDEELGKILVYLNLSNSTVGLQDKLSAVKLQGEMGDSTGVAAYASVSRKPMEKWQGTLCNTIRVKWCMHYLDVIGAENLRTIGYATEELKKQLLDCRMGSKHLVSDIGHMTYGILLPFLIPRSLKEKMRLLPYLRKIYPIY